MGFRPVPGWKRAKPSHKSSPKERLEWAYEQWIKDPSISVNGRQGMVSRMLEVFGSGVHTQQLQEVHARAAEITRKEEQARKDREVHFNNLGDKLKLVALKPEAVPRAEKRAADVPPPPPVPPPPAAPPPKPESVVVPEVLARAPIMQPRQQLPLPPANGANGTHHGRERPIALATTPRRTPDGTSPRLPADAKIRADYARQIVTPGMNSDQLSDAVRERFGWGVRGETLQQIIDDARQNMPTEGPDAPDGSQKNNRAHVAVREAYARSVAKPGMTGQRLIALVRQRFGWGITAKRATDIISEAAREAPASTSPAKPPPAPQPAEPYKTPVRSAPPNSDPGSHIKAAVELLLESVPGLVALRVTREPGQQPDIEFEIRVTQSGRFRL